MTEITINTNFKPFKEVEKGDFFTDAENHLCYCIKKDTILDLTANNLLIGLYYLSNDMVTIHKKVEIRVI